MELETLATKVVHQSFLLHRMLGPGLLESVYETMLAEMLRREQLTVERQKPVPVRMGTISVDEGFRADLLIEGRLLLELKAVEKMVPVHQRQVITYLRLLDLPLGFLINFGAARFKEGIQRIVNKHAASQASILRIHTSAVT